jgi:hypothetical protein
MAEVTYYVALPFVAADDGIAPGEHTECFNPNAAVMRAEALSRKEGHVGAVAFSRTGGFEQHQSCRFTLTNFAAGRIRSPPQTVAAQLRDVCSTPVSSTRHVRSWQILFSNSGSGCQAFQRYPCRAHCSLRGRGGPSA